MSHNKRLQEYADEYRREHGDGPFQLGDIANWMVRNGKWSPSFEEAEKILMPHLREAMRTQYVTDPDGRRVRRNHSLKMKIVENDGSSKQMSLWHTIDTAPAPFMKRSFQQRRDSIADDCWQLKQDVDSYNRFHNKGEQLFLELDFREDMEEREIDLGPDESESAA